MELWILFPILTALALVITNLIDKFVLTKLVKNPNIPAIYLGLFGLMVGLGVLFFKRQNLSLLIIILALISGALYYLAVLLYFNAVKIEEISRVVPLFYLNIIFVAIFSRLFLGENFSNLTDLGIFLLFIGAVLINFKAKLTLGKAFWLMLLASLILAGSRILTKYILIDADYWNIFAYARIGMFLAAIPLIIKYFSEFKNSLNHALILSSSEFFNLLGLLFLTIATSLGPITLVSSLASLQPLLLFVFTSFISIFKPNLILEEIKGKLIFFKLISIIMMILGVILII